MKKKYIILLIVVFFIIVGLFKSYTVLGVTKNIKSLDLLKSIYRFEKSNEPIYRVSTKPLSYIVSESNNFVSYMKQEKFDLVDQLGSIYMFEKGDKKITFKSHQITKKYLLIEEIYFNN